MGFKDWLDKQPDAMYEANYNLYKDRIEKKRGADAGSHSLEGVTAVIDTGEALSSRITLTRLVGTGVIGLFWKKKRGGSTFLLIEGPDFAWVEEVDRKKQKPAQLFAAKVREAARKPLA
jgi:hypothetical protein